MREIKFRAWDGNREWKSSEYETMADFFDDARIFNYNPIEQYTGLKDKNGREIYEGDIIRAWIDFGPGGEGLREYVVTLTEWGHNIQQWPYQEKGFYPPEVIGNIHENPELLGHNPGPRAE